MGEKMDTSKKNYK